MELILLFVIGVALFAIADRLSRPAPPPLPAPRNLRGTGGHIPLTPAKTFPNTLLVGPGGLGKTTLAEIIHREAASIYGVPVSFHALTPGQLQSQADLDRLLLQIQPGDFVFIDEVHGLKQNVAESLYKAIQDGKHHLSTGNKLDLGAGFVLTQGGGYGGQFATIELPRCTFLAGTTDGGILPRPLNDRFNRIDLEHYSPEELAIIAENYIRRRQTAQNLGEYIGQEKARREVEMELSALRLPERDLPITPAAQELIGKISMGVPRIALKYTRKSRTWALVNGLLEISEAAVKGYMEMAGIDDNGLLAAHHRIIAALLNAPKYTLGNQALATAVGVSVSDIEHLYFPNLVFLGLGTRNSRSMKTLTAKALAQYAALLTGETPPPDDPGPAPAGGSAPGSSGGGISRAGKTAQSAAPATLYAWLRANPAHRIRTDDLRRYGFGSGSRENATLIMQVGSPAGQSVDLVADEAIREGIIPPPPPEYNPADWFMEHVRGNRNTAEGDIEEKLRQEQNYWRKLDEQGPPPPLEAAPF